MATDDRKRRILDHLAKSADGVKYGVQYGTSRTTSKSQESTPSVDSTPSVELPPPPPIPQPVIPSPQSKTSRKRQVMDHVKTSSGNFGDFSFGVEKRLKKITEHLRDSLG